MIMTQDIANAENILIMVLSAIMVLTWIMFAFFSYQDGSKVHNAEFTRNLQRRDRYILFLLAVIQITMLALSNQVSLLTAAYLSTSYTALQTPEVQENKVIAPLEAPADTAPVIPKADKLAALPPVESRMPFSDIIEFNEENSKQQAYIDLLKQRYETWLVTYYYLQKCGKVPLSDLDIINNAMKHDLESAKADDKVAGNITVAANGSYKEMYSDIPCDEASIKSTKASYDTTMGQIKPAASPVKPVEKK